MSELLDDALFAADDAFMNEPVSEEDLEKVYATSNEESSPAPTKIERPVGVKGLDVSAFSVMPGVTVGKTGVNFDPEPEYAVNKVYFKFGHKTLISILSDNVVRCATHYDQDLGKFLCFGGQCCKDAKQKASQRHVYPVLVYETDDEGCPISRNYQFMTMTVGYSAYKTLTKIQEQVGSLVGIDILFTVPTQDDEKYQKVEPVYCGAARWTQIDGCAEAMNKFWNENMSHLLDCLGKKMTAEEYAKEKAGDELPFHEVPQVDFNAVFN